MLGTFDGFGVAYIVAVVAVLVTAVPGVECWNGVDWWNGRVF